jgi:hypothetical protein
MGALYVGGVLIMAGGDLSIKKVKGERTSYTSEVWASKDEGGGVLYGVVH